jgi:hypothetical protein
MASDLPAILLPLTVGVLLLAVGVLQAWNAVRARTSEQVLRREIEVLRRDTKSLQRELGALCSGAYGVGSHLSRLDRQLMRLNERQEQFELRDSVHREYDQAVHMIQRGAGVDEIASRCNLARAEVELLTRLHDADSPPQEDQGMRSVA